MVGVVFHDLPEDAKYVVCSGTGGCGSLVLDTPEGRVRHYRNLHKGRIPSVTDIPLPDRDERDIWSGH